MSQLTGSLEELCAPKSSPGDGLWASCDCEDFTADPDIAGIGVVGSFVASSCLTIVGTCLYLALIRAYIGEEANERKDFNWLDRFTRRKIVTPIVKFLFKVPWIKFRKTKIRSSLFSLVLSLADTQLVTGNAMLIAAIVKLQSNTITVYHFSMVTNLAWFSANVHLLALLAIRTELIGSHKRSQRRMFQSNKARSKWKRIPATLSRSADVWVRVVGMLTLAALLALCSYVSGAEGWDDNYNCPASCSWAFPRGGRPRQWMIVNMVFLIRGHISSCLLFSRRVVRWWVDSARHWFLDDQGLEPETPKELSPLWKFLLCFRYALGSETFDVFIDGFVWFALGVYYIFDDRNSMHKVWRDVPEESKKENDLQGFGQLVPLLLLGLPLLQVLQTYCGISRNEQTHEAQEAWAQALAALDVARVRVERVLKEFDPENKLETAINEWEACIRELREKRKILNIVRST